MKQGICISPCGWPDSRIDFVVAGFQLAAGTWKLESEERLWIDEDRQRPNRTDNHSTSHSSESRSRNRAEVAAAVVVSVEAVAGVVATAAAIVVDCAGSSNSCRP